MRRRHKLLAWIIGVPVTLFVVLVSALVITLSLFNWNKLKPTIDAHASAAIGRTFAINGNLGVEWRRNIVITIVATAFIQLSFSNILRVPLPRGLLERVMWW